MSLINPANLYNGGAVVFNQSPHTALLMNLMAKKQAEEQALEKYYRDFDKQITPEGMDNRYVAKLKQNEAERSKFFKQNRAKLLNPKLDVDGSAQTGFNQLFQGSLGIVNEGKEVAKKHEKHTDMGLRLAQSDMLPGGYWDAMQNAYNLKLDDQNYRPFDENIFQEAMKPYDATKHLASFDGIKRAKLESLGALDTKTFNRDKTTTEYYDQTAKNLIGDIAAGDYKSKPAFRKHINELVKDEALFKKMNEVSKKEFGHEIDIAHPEQFAAAYILHQKQPSIVTTTKEFDKKAKDDYDFAQAIAQQNRGFAHAEKMALLNDRLAKGRMAMRAAKTEAGQRSVLEGFVNEQFDDGKPTAVTVNGEKYDGREVKVPKSVSDKFIVDKGYSSEKSPATWIMTNDKKYLIPVFKTGEHTKPGGNPLIDREKSKPILMSEYRSLLGNSLLSKKDAADEYEEYFNEDGEPIGEAPVRASGGAKAAKTTKGSFVFPNGIKKF